MLQSCIDIVGRPDYWGISQEGGLVGFVIEWICLTQSALAIKTASSSPTSHTATLLLFIGVSLIESKAQSCAYLLWAARASPRVIDLAGVYTGRRDS